MDIRIRLHELYSTNKTDWHEWVFDRMIFDGDCCMIEFGCGSGSLWEKNRSKLKDNWAITLTDQSEGMLAKTRQSIGDIPNVTFKALDVQATGLVDAAFDAAIANHMLYHVPDIGKALAEIKRILKQGGTLYASTNGTKHVHEIYEFVTEFDPSLPFERPRNAQHFGLENGERQLKEHFGNVQLIRYESSLHVTSAQDLADYMFSVGTGLKEDLVRRDSYGAFLTFLENKKNEHGFIHVSKESGLFICS